MSDRFALSILLVLAVLGCALAIPWNNRNNPNQWQDGMVYNFNQLPLNGTLDVVPWSDTYWPSYQSGIANRWGLDDPQYFAYDLNSKADLQSMPTSQLATLSPAGMRPSRCELLPLSAIT